MSLALSPNKRFLVAGNAGLSPTVWDLSNIHNPTRAAQFDEPAGSPTATAMAFSPDGRWLLIGTDAGTTTLWDLHGWDPTRDVPPSHRTVGQRNAFPVQSVAFSANGTDFAVSTANSLLFYATADPTTERSSVDVQSRSVAAMVFTPSSLLVTADGEAKTATVWNAGDLADTEEPITVSAFASIRDHRDAVLAVALSRDGRTVATAGRDGTVVLTDVGTTDPRHLNTITVGADQINALMFVPGHNLLAIAADDNVLLWRTGS
jgi:WD40 repeat protein